MESSVFKRRFYAAASSLAQSDSGITRCTPKSVIVAVWNCARVGLVPDPSLGHVWVIPYGDQATVQIGYKGRVELARRSGHVTVVRTRIIHANDEYTYRDGLNPQLDITPWWVRGKDSPGKLVATYAVADFAGGGKDLYVSPVWEIEQSRQRSQAARSGRGPWVDDPDAMARVVPIRRAWSTWPQSPEMAYAEMLDWQADSGQSQENDDVSTMLPDVADMDEGMSSYGPPPRWEQIAIKYSEANGITRGEAIAKLNGNQKKAKQPPIAELADAQLNDLEAILFQQKGQTDGAKDK